MTPYDEAKVYAFLEAERAAYDRAGRLLDAFYPIWAARMQYDAVTQGYPASHAKHLTALRQALGLAPAPPPRPAPPVFDPAVRQPWPRPMPPDIDTTNLLEVTDRVDWTLMFYDCSDDRSAWVGYVMDVAGEGHDLGWKADGYWRLEKMSKAEGNGQGYVWPPR